MRKTLPICLIMLLFFKLCLLIYSDEKINLKVVYI